jgi:hypothetical protein
LAVGRSSVTFVAMRVLGLLFSATICIAGEFVNLTFDEPDLSGSLTPIYPEFPSGPLSGNTSQILRGWTIRADTQPHFGMTYSPFGSPTGEGLARLVGNSPELAQTPFGANTLFLRSDHTLPGGGPVIRVQQTGTVPADAAGLWIFGGGSLQMFINGQRVTDPKIGTLSDPVVDMSSFAGQTIDLEFLIVKGGSTRLDVFGWVAVPEPQTWALLGVGAAAVLCATRRKT